MSKRRSPKIRSGARQPTDPGELQRLKQQLMDLQETVDRLQGRLLRGETPEQASSQPASLLALKKFIPATADGWMGVIMSGTRTSLPSGIAVTVTSQVDGRDFGVINEGIYANNTFDIKQGNLTETAERKSSVEVLFDVATNPAVIDGKTYDRRVTVTWAEGGTSKSVGPFPARTKPTSPPPKGTHDIEIADFPHDLGLPYGAFATVWFRIGHQGDRYIHPGRESDGCITCAPGNWPAIYAALNFGRLGDGKNVAKLKVV